MKEKSESHTGIPESKGKLYLQIFTSTFYVSAFTFGGGYAIVPLLQAKFSDELGWVNKDEILNLIAIAQSAPGPIAVNAALILGYEVGGLAGALVATLGTVLPPLVIISVISAYYTAFLANKAIALGLKAMASGVTAVVVDVLINMVSDLLRQKKIFSFLLLVGAFVVNLIFNINIVFIILFCALSGLALGHLGRKMGKELI